MGLFDLNFIVFEVLSPNSDLKWKQGNFFPSEKKSCLILINNRFTNNLNNIFISIFFIR